MAKAVLAIAAAFLPAMTVFASAQGPSYESRGYGGPLYVGPNFEAGGQHSPPSYDPKSSSKQRYKEKPVYRATKKRDANTAKNHTAPPPEKVDTAKTTPLNKEVESENSTISRASLDTNESGEKNTIEREAIATKEPSPAARIDCKKFFASIGMTLTVPCE